MPLQVQLNAAQLQLPAAAAADAVGAADDSSSRAVMRSSSGISMPLAAVIVSATVRSSIASAGSRPLGTNTIEYTMLAALAMGFI
jgi:hypothetical protein